MNLRAKISNWVDDFFGDDLSGLRFVFAVFIGFAFFLMFLFSDEKRTLDNWSYVGASFGIISALFTGLAFAVLIITMRQQKRQLKMQSEELKLQRKELKATRKVLKKQNKEFRLQSETMKRQQFEHTFFKMLKFKISLLNEISILYDPRGFHVKKENARNGKAAIIQIDKLLIRSLPGRGIASRKSSAETIYNDSKSFEESMEEYEVHGLKEWASHSCNLHIYLLENNIDHEVYASILKDQFSESERVMLFYMDVLGLINKKQKKALNKLKFNQYIPEKKVYIRYRKLVK